MWKEKGQTKRVHAATPLLDPSLRTTSYNSRNQLPPCEGYHSVLTAVDAYCCGKVDLLIFIYNFYQLRLN